MTVPTEPVRATMVDVPVDGVPVDVDAPRIPSVVVETRGAAVVLTVTGDLDFVTTPAIRDRVLNVLAQRPAVEVVDLLEAEFVGSAGLGLLVEVAQLRPGTTLRVVAAGATRRSIQVTGLDTLLGLSVSVADALTGSEADPYSSRVPLIGGIVRLVSAGFLTGRQCGKDRLDRAGRCLPLPWVAHLMLINMEAPAGMLLRGKGFAGGDGGGRYG